MGIENYAIRREYGTEILSLATREGAVKYVVGFDLYEGGPSAVALLDWLMSWRAHRVLPNLWHFDDALENSARHMAALRDILRRESAEPHNLNDAILLVAGSECWLLRRAELSTTIVPLGEVPPAPADRPDAGPGQTPIGMPIGPDGKPIIPPGLRKGPPAGGDPTQRRGPRRPGSAGQDRGN